MEEKSKNIELLDDIILELEKKAKKLNRIGMLASLVSLIVGVVLFWDIKQTTIEHLTKINEAQDTTATVAYLIVRSSALGTIAVTFLYSAFKITIANFDQSMRFVKRKMGAMYLKMLFTKYGESVKEQVSLNDIMESFYVWNLNVESAFTLKHKDDLKHDSFIPNFILKRKNSEEVNVNSKSGQT